MPVDTNISTVDPPQRFPVFLELPMEEEEQTQEVDEYATQRKYILTEESKMIEISAGEVEVFRILADRDFGTIKEGTYGGFVQSEDNLSHEGDCWIYDDAIVFEDAAVYRNAKIQNTAHVFGRATITDDAIIRDMAAVKDEAVIEGHAIISGYATVQDSASVAEFAQVRDWAVIANETRITGKVIITQSAIVRGSPWLTGHVIVEDNAYIDAVATIDGYSRIDNSQAILNHFNPELLCALADLQVNTRDYRTNFSFWEQEFTWNIRAGKPFQFVPSLFSTVSQVQIIRVPYEDTQAEGFDPYELFVQGIPAGTEIPDAPDTEDSEEPDSPEMPDASDVPEEPESPEEPDEPGESEEPSSPPDEPADEPPMRPIIYSPNDTFIVDEEEVFYFLVKHGMVGRLYAVKLSPIPYGLSIKPLDPATEDLIWYVRYPADTPLEGSSTEPVNVWTEGFLLEAQDSYNFRIQALTHCKYTPYVRVREDLLIDKRSLEEQIPREIWVQIQDPQELHTNGTVVLPLKLSDYTHSIQLDEDSVMDGVVTKVSFVCRTVEDKIIAYQYDLSPVPEPRYKSKWDLIPLEAGESDIDGDTQSFTILPDVALEGVEAPDLTYTVTLLATRVCSLAVFVGDTEISVFTAECDEHDEIQYVFDPLPYQDADGNLPDSFRVVTHVEVEDEPDQTYVFHTIHPKPEEPEPEPEPEEPEKPEESEK